jgi:predicted permease
MLEGHPFPIVGVIDPGFTGLDIGEQSQVYVPLCTKDIVQAGSLDSRSNWFLRIVGRPKPGMTAEQIDARLATLAPGIIETTVPPNWPADALARYRKAQFSVDPADKGFSVLRTTFQEALFMLMAVVGIVLLIACANVANLLLARATTRQREIAVRLALGAGRSRLIRQLLTESTLLSLLGAMLGIGFALWGSRLLVHMISTRDRVVSLDLTLDPRVLTFAIAVATVTGLLFGLAPAWRAGRVDPQVALKSQGRGVTEGHSRFSIGKALVVAQIALSLVLVAGAALLLGSWHRLATTDPGFRSDQILLVNVDMRSGGVTGDQRGTLYRQMLERFRTLPAIRAASMSGITPIGSSSWNNIVKADGFAPASPDDALIWVNEVSDGYFSTMKTVMLAGRDFGSGDVLTSPKVAIVNEAMARRVFGTSGAVGRQFHFQEGESYGPPIEVVGVVANTKYRSIREQDEPIIYLAASQDEALSSSMSFEIRSDQLPASLVPSLKAVVQEINPRFSLDFVPLEQQISESLRLPRTLATLSGFFGGLALLLAMIGLYGIMAYSVARRRNEIGVRIALGAAQGRVIQMVLGEVGRMVIVGLAIGTLITLGLARLVASFLYEISPNDPGTLGLSAMVLAIIALTAAMAPAWRASRLDPVAALRED